MFFSSGRQIGDFSLKSRMHHERGHVKLPFKWSKKKFERDARVLYGLLHPAFTAPGGYQGISAFMQ